MQATEVRPTTQLINEEESGYNTYTYICTEIYAYMFGKISFLQLLDRLEEILGIESPQPRNKTSQSEREQQSMLVSDEAKTMHDDR